jgi:predicted hydrocarbon binding protein
MLYPGGGIVVSQAGSELLVTDFGSLAGLGETAPEPICFLTIGLIRGVLGTVTSEELDVEEVGCKALGTEACQFRVRFLK